MRTMAHFKYDEHKILNEVLKEYVIVLTGIDCYTSYIATKENKLKIFTNYIEESGLKENILVKDVFEIEYEDVIDFILEYMNSRDSKLTKLLND